VIYKTAEIVRNLSLCFAIYFYVSNRMYRPHLNWIEKNWKAVFVLFTSALIGFAIGGS